MAIVDIEYLIREYTRAIRIKSAAVFIGAGLSMPAGFVSWKQLLSKAASDLGLDVEKEQYDLIGLAQYYNNRHRRGALNQLLTEEFTKLRAPTRNHQLLSQLPLDTYWTTNYDSLIEDSLRAERKITDVKITTKNLAVTVPHRDAVVYKMHGDIHSLSDAIITRDDYDRFSTSRKLYTEILSGDLVSKTFLFLGYSFNDPDTKNILSIVSQSLNEDVRPHFCIMRKCCRLPSMTDADFAYEEAKQNLQIEDLHRFSINVALIDDYPEITNILEKIKSEILKDTIFIAGSAAEYGTNFSKSDAELLMHKLSYKLVGNEYKIISGFGLGVGSFVINGVLDYSDSVTKGRNLSTLTLRPFPQSASGGKDIQELWREYRYDILSEAGIAIFLFGNKQDNDKIINADGLIKEFEIAHELGVKIIPIGMSGYVAEIILDNVLASFNEFYEDESIKDALIYLNKRNNSDGTVKEIDSIIEVIIELANKIRG